MLPTGFEPVSQGPKPCEIDRYSTGVWQGSEADALCIGGFGAAGGTNVFQKKGSMDSRLGVCNLRRTIIYWWQSYINVAAVTYKCGEDFGR